MQAWEDVYFTFYAAQALAQSTVGQTYTNSSSEANWADLCPNPSTSSGTN